MTPELILQWAKEAIKPDGEPDHGEYVAVVTDRVLTRFANIVEQHIRADEREQCAKVCDDKIEYMKQRQQDLEKEKLHRLVGMMQLSIDSTQDTAKKIRARKP